MSVHFLPSKNQQKSIDLIIQNTRMNKLVWEKIDEDTLKAENAEIYVDNNQIIMEDVLLQRFPNVPIGFERYKITIKNEATFDVIDSIKKLGQYLFCEDYDKGYSKKEH